MREWRRSKRGEMKWYVSQNRKAQGPLTEQRVEMLLRWGKISRAAYICDEQSSCWVPITRSRFGALLAPPAPEHSGSPAAVVAGGRPAAAARAWHALHPWLAFASLILFCTLAFLVSLRLSTSSSSRSAMGKGSFVKSGSFTPSGGRAPAMGRFAR